MFFPICFLRLFNGYTRMLRVKFGTSILSKHILDFVMIHYMVLGPSTLQMPVNMCIVHQGVVS